MEQIQNSQISDLDVRHDIYTSFVETSRPPTTQEVAERFKVSVADVETAFDRLAEAHQIALAPGSHSIWMAHPFSGIPTNFITEVAGKKYWGN